MYSVSSSSKGLCASSPSLLPEGKQNFPPSMNQLYSAPLLSLGAVITFCGTLLAFAPAFNLKVINIPFAFRMTVNSSAATTLFCAPVRNSHDGAVLSSFSRVPLLVVVNCWEVLLVSVPHILASINFRNRWGLLSCFWGAPVWAPCDLDLLIWERSLDFPCRSRNLQP